MKKNEINIGVIGQGFVGNALYQKFKSFFKTYTYDIKKELSNSEFEYIIKNCGVIFICLPTPMNKDGSCNTDLVEKVVEDLSASFNGICVIKSTVPPGTIENLNKKYKNFQVVFNPEFLTERNAIEDFDRQKRIILGGPRPSTSILKQIYSRVFPNAFIVKTSSSTAEMVKYFTNCFLATKVSYANEMFKLCQALDIDYDKVVEYSILDERFGKSHWSVPGPDGDYGFGGHCFPKDLRAILKISDENHTINNVLKSVVKTNDQIRKHRDWEEMKGRAII